jgi:hypothetical protein
MVGLSIFTAKVSTNLSTAKTQTFYISTLTSETARAQTESKLLQLKGVVSFLLDIKTHRATVRHMLSSTELIGGMKRVGITNAVPISDNSENPIQKENEPQYLPEESAQPAASSWFSLSIWGSSTVDERKESQRRQEKKTTYKSGKFMSKLYSVGEAFNIF